MGDPPTVKPRPAAWARRIILALCLVVFVFSTGMLFWEFYRAGKEQAANQALGEQVHQMAEESPEGSQETTGSQTGMLPQYEALWRQNNDLAGWLSIDGTQIDYPVMYTPEDPEHYLRRAFDGSHAVSGSLFLAEGCPPEANHAIIYGHQMKNGTMFGGLSQYEDPDYAKAHPEISFDTLYRQGVYQVMGAFYSQVYTDQDQGVFRYYQYSDLSDPAVFGEYVRQVKAAALYDTGITAQYGDSLLTLSTCSKHVEDGRFVVVARKVP